MNGSAARLIEALQKHQPEETIFVSASRAFGRRVLTTLAREDMLIGVHAETPLTLSAELCAELLADESVCRAIDDAEGAELVLSCLNGGLFGTGKAACLATAQELYRIFGELDAACVGEVSDSADLKGNAKLKELQSIREAYQKKKGGRLLDRADLLRHALEKAKERRHPLCRAHYVLLGSYAPSALERELIEALSEVGGLTVAPLAVPEGERLPTGCWQEMPTDRADALKDKEIKLMRCRGAETEADYIFRDLLESSNTTPAEDCAIVYLSGEYAPLLFETAGRYGIPVTMGAGIPFSASPLYFLFDGIGRLRESDYDATRVRRLLDSGALSIPGRCRLSAQLDALQIGFGRDRYSLLWKPDAAGETDGEKEAWRSFFEALFALTEPKNPDLSAQKSAVLRFLSGYVMHVSEEQIAAYDQLRTLVSQVRSLRPNELLLTRLIDLMKDASYRCANAAPGTVFCTTLSQALFTGRKKLYICGLSRYCLDTAGRETACFLDEERELFRRDHPTLKTTAELAQERSYRFWELLADHEGSVTLSYSDFDITRKSELSPSPAFSMIAARTKQAVKAVSYRPERAISAWDHLLRDAGTLDIAMPEPDLSAPPAELHRELTQKERIAEMTFSASSMETALRCPFKFCLQHILHVYEPSKTVRGEKNWLLPTELGTFCHAVLEEYYKASPQPSDVTPIFERAWAELNKTYPPVAGWMMERDKRLARAMVDSAIAWTAKEGRTVLSTEEKFGPERDENGAVTKDFQITVGATPIRFTGSIDRVDQCGDGKFAIVDYKTSNPVSFRGEMREHLHLQHYLYALAEEKLHPGRSVAESGYLLMRSDGGYIPVDEGKEKREEYARRVEGLLGELSDEEKALTCAPSYELRDGKLAVGSAEKRIEQWESCRHYCGFASLCTIRSKEDF